MLLLNACSVMRFSPGFCCYSGSDGNGFWGKVLGDIISFDCNTVVSQCISEVCRSQILTCKRCLLTMDDFLFVLDFTIVWLL